MAEINFLPVCSNCNTVLFGEEITYEEHKDILYAKNKFLQIPCGQVSPGTCPKCNAIFTSITLPTKLPFVAPGKEVSIYD